MKVAQPPRANQDRVQRAYARPLDSLLSIADRFVRFFASPGEDLKVTGRPNNNVVLTPGNHGKLTIDESGTVLSFAPGAYVEQLVLNENCIVRGADVRHPSARPGAAVQVNAAAVIIDRLSVSTDEGPSISISATTSAMVSGAYMSQASGSEFVSVENGGRAMLTSVVFAPSTSTAGFGVNNAGAIVNVDLTGSVNLPALAHNFVTVISEV